MLEWEMPKKLFKREMILWKYGDRMQVAMAMPHQGTTWSFEHDEFVMISLASNHIWI